MKRETPLSPTSTTPPACLGWVHLSDGPPLPTAVVFLSHQAAPVQILALTEECDTIRHRGMPQGKRKYIYEYSTAFFSFLNEICKLTFVKHRGTFFVQCLHLGAIQVFILMQLWQEQKVMLDRTTSNWSDKFIMIEDESSLLLSLTRGI